MEAQGTVPSPQSSEHTYRQLFGRSSGKLQGREESACSCTLPLPVTICQLPKSVEKEDPGREWSADLRQRERERTSVSAFSQSTRPSAEQCSVVPGTKAAGNIWVEATEDPRQRAWGGLHRPRRSLLFTVRKQEKKPSSVRKVDTKSTGTARPAERGRSSSEAMQELQKPRLPSPRKGTRS